MILKVPLKQHFHIHHYKMYTVLYSELIKKVEIMNCATFTLCFSDKNVEFGKAQEVD